MSTRKLKSKTKFVSEESKEYDDPKSTFQWLIESAEVSQQTKDSLESQITLYNPVELQHNVN